MKTRIRTDRLLHVRQLRTLSQSQLGKAVGCDRHLISNIEHGRKPVNLHLLVKMANALDVSVDYLLGRDKYVDRFFMIDGYHLTRE